MIKKSEIINSDDYDEDIPRIKLRRRQSKDVDIPQYPIKSRIGQSKDEEKSDSSIEPKNKNWERNRKSMIKNLNEGKNVKQSTRDKYKPKYDKNTGKYY